MITRPTTSCGPAKTATGPRSSWRTSSRSSSRSRCSRNTLIVTGRQNQDGNTQYLHRSIARDFERRFGLADFVEVKHASCEDGMLQIELVRELPEAMKPREIQVGPGKPLEGTPMRTIDQKVA